MSRSFYAESVRVSFRFDPIRFGSMWFGLARFGPMLSDSVAVVGFGPVLPDSMLLFGSSRIDSIRFRLDSIPVRFGSVRFGSVRFGSVRFGSVRFGSVRFGSIFGSSWFNSVSSWMGPTDRLGDGGGGQFLSVSRASALLFWDCFSDCYTG